MIVHVDPDDPVPAYEQLRSQIATMVATGGLTQGDRLPAIRRLAADLGLAPGTVQRAYRELEQQGLVEGSGRRGTRVAPPDRWRLADESDAVADAARRLAIAAAQAGLDRDALHTAVDRAMDAIVDSM